MKLRIAINGFGRIGRNILRAFFEGNHENIEIVSVNDLSPFETNVHLFRYDSIHGHFPGKINIYDNIIDIGFGPIKIYQENIPENIPWNNEKIDIVFECTGKFTNKFKAENHLLSETVKHVIISSPCEGSDLTVVYGVNHRKLKKEHRIISNSSCTTNCLAPLVKVLNDNIGIEKGFMTTIHSYTNDQSILDTFHSDLYRSRAASLSIIPTSTGAAKNIGLVIPEMKGRLDGIAVRVPTPNVSLIDFNFLSKKKTTVSEINESLKIAACGYLKNILYCTDEKLVSHDFNHNTHSSIVHLDQTKVVSDTLCHVLSWYDNEWGFSNRMLDISSYLTKII